MWFILQLIKEESYRPRGLRPVKWADTNTEVMHFDGRANEKQ